MKVSIYDFVVVRDGDEVLIPEIEASLSHEREDFHLPAYWVMDEYTVLASGIYRAIAGLSHAEKRDLEERAMAQMRDLC